MTSSPPPYLGQRAVQYLRMSREHQRYSLANQAATIADYAEVDGYEVVRTYSDAGRSGVNLKGRPQLQQLLSDCLSPHRDFDAILVLDVSRWGRFQDPDQAAYCEYLCRGAGVRVVYVAETFDNDGGLVSSVVKHLKRVMAAEYSRELSEKTRRGKRRQAIRGYALGGPAPYGFRRRVVDHDGDLRHVLEPGERKPRPEHEVRYALGPRDEVRAIQRIFREYVHQGRRPHAIARRLNNEGKTWKGGQSWTPQRVIAVLDCELVAGNQVFGKRTHNLHSVTYLPRSAWQRVQVCDPVVSPSTFAAAKRRRDRLQRCAKTDEELLADLRRRLEKQHYLSATVINSDPEMAQASCYRARFGSLLGAYRLIGYGVEMKRHVRTLDGRVMSDNDLFSLLRTHHEERGRISAKTIRADSRLPSVSHIARLFGGLRQAYMGAGIVKANRSVTAPHRIDAKLGMSPPRSAPGFSA